MIRRILTALTTPITDRLDHVLEQLGDLDAAVADIDGDAWTELAAVQVALGKHYTGSVVDGVKSVVAMLEAPRASLANYVATLADIRNALGRHAHPQFTTVENVRGLVVAYEGEREQTSLAHQAAGEVRAECEAEIQRLKAKLDEVEDHRDTATEAAKAHRRELDILHPHIARLLKIDNSCDVGAAVDRAEQNRKTRFAHARELVDVRTALKPWTDGHQNHDNAGTVVSELVAEWQRITQAEDAGNEEVNRLVTKLAAERDCGQEGVCATAPGCARHWQERSRELVADRDKLAQENTRLAGDLTYAQRELRLVTDERKVQARKTPNEAITRLMAVHGYTGGAGGWQREGGPVWPLETAIEGIEATGRVENEKLRKRVSVCEIALDSRREEIGKYNARVAKLEGELRERTDELGAAQRLIAEAYNIDDDVMVALGDPVKGAEAEELRKGVEDLIKAADSNDGVVSWHALQSLLDRVNARDSNAFLAQREKAPTLPLDREHLGRIVREVWIAWAKEQPNPKPSWLVPWEGLSEPDKEVDRRIGERLAAEGLAILATRIIVTPDKAAALREAGWEERVSGWSPDGGYSAWTLDGAYDAMVSARGKAPVAAETHASTVAPDLATMGNDLRAAGWHCSPDAGWTKGLDGEYMSIADAHAMMLADKAEAKDNRCKVCGWPIKATIDEGCTAESCSYRPEPGSDEHARLLADRAKAQPNPFTAERFMQLALLNAGWGRHGVNWQHPRGYDALYNTEAAFECMLADRAVPPTTLKHCGGKACKKPYKPSSDLCDCICDDCDAAEDHDIYAHGPNRARGL